MKFGSFLNKIETARDQTGFAGQVIENEYLGTVNSTKYKERAYNLLHPIDPKSFSNPDEQYTQILKNKDAAQETFENTLALADKRNRIGLKDAMRLVEECQTGNPENPNRFFAKALYDSVRDNFSDKQFDKIAFKKKIEEATEMIVNAIIENYQKNNN